MPAAESPQFALGGAMEDSLAGKSASEPPPKSWSATLPKRVKRARQFVFRRLSLVVWYSNRLSISSTEAFASIKAYKRDIWPALCQERRWSVYDGNSCTGQLVFRSRKSRLARISLWPARGRASFPTASATAVAAVSGAATTDWLTPQGRRPATAAKPRRPAAARHALPRQPSRAFVRNCTLGSGLSGSCKKEARSCSCPS
mmetsp:Transcript_72611/g.234959  ORF Transcript_72611/g.234959 Transcript_72611/m.234959 type:complete len:201 (-) Transcript_72611:39-641(-)